MESYSSHTCFPFISHLCPFPGVILRRLSFFGRGERQLMLDRQSSHAVDFREAVNCCNKPYRPF